MFAVKCVVFSTTKVQCFEEKRNILAGVIELLCVCFFFEKYMNLSSKCLFMFHRRNLRKQKKTTLILMRLLHLLFMSHNF